MDEWDLILLRRNKQRHEQPPTVKEQPSQRSRKNEALANDILGSFHNMLTSNPPAPVQQRTIEPIAVASPSPSSFSNSFSSMIQGLLDSLQIFRQKRPPPFITRVNPTFPCTTLSRQDLQQIRTAYKEQSVVRCIRRAKKLVPLSIEEVEVLQYAMKQPSSTILVERSRIEITSGLLRCLQPREWLNDEVINFYMELLKERNQRPHSKGYRPQCAFFNTFFWTKLTLEGYTYKNVQRWTRRSKTDIFQHDLVMIPINISNTHWALGVLNISAKSIEYWDSMGSGVSRHFFQSMRRYLADELWDKKETEMDFEGWGDILPNAPHQTNGYDCGMFLCKFADFKSDGLWPSFDQSHIEYFRKRMIVEICNDHII